MADGNVRLEEHVTGVLRCGQLNGDDAVISRWGVGYIHLTAFNHQRPVTMHQLQPDNSHILFLAIVLSTSIRWRLRSMSEGRQNSCSVNQLTGNQTQTGANLMERQCRCRCRIKSVIVQLLWVWVQLPTLYNTAEYPGYSGVPRIQWSTQRPIIRLSSRLQYRNR